MSGSGTVSPSRGGPEFKAFAVDLRGKGDPLKFLSGITEKFYGETDFKEIIHIFFGPFKRGSGITFDHEEEVGITSRNGAAFG